MEQGADVAAAVEAGLALRAAAAACKGFSGRMLRKLPFLAHAASTCAGGACARASTGCADFAHALGAAARAEAHDRSFLNGR